MSLKKLPIVIQLIMMLMIVMFIPTTIIVCYSTVSLEKYSEKEIGDSVLAQLRSNGALNERELFNVAQNVLAIADSSDLKNMKSIISFDVLNSNYTNISKSLKLLAHLQAVQNSNDMIDSIAFIPEDWDYIVSSKTSIIRKKEYGELKWLNDAYGEIKRVSGCWYPRVENGKYMITYLYRLNRLTTSLKGVIVVNIPEDKINKLLNYGNYKTGSSAFFMMKDGTLLSHEDKSLLFQNERLPDHIKNILTLENSAGTFYMNQKNQRVLCAYYMPSNRDWIYGVTYPMKDVLAGVKLTRNKQIFLMVIIMGIGSILTIIYAKRFARPMRLLADEIKKKNGLPSSEEHGNEITFLVQAFEGIEKQEESLYSRLKEKEKDTKSTILHNLLAGEIEHDLEKEELTKIFPYKLFMVGIIVVDHRKAYLEKLDPNSRSYQRYLLFDEIRKIFPEDLFVQSIRYDGGCIAVIINMEGYDQVKSPKQLMSLFVQIQKVAEGIFKHTVSVGISGVHNGAIGVQECVYEAVEASNKKIFKGNNSIIFWQPAGNKLAVQQYYYPYENAEKITNLLGVGDREGIEQELSYIVKQILESADELNYENVFMIFNQLAGSAIKFMMERHIAVEKIFGKKSDIYGAIASAETVNELKETLSGYYEKIMSYVLEKKEDYLAQSKYGERILEYLNNHYKEDILYEELARQIGISYSYLRRIVKEETGKSVNDYINKLRIEKAKELLVGTNRSIEQIAEEVGYHNVQSIVRYFRKFEGITPKEFKGMNERENVNDPQIISIDD